MNKARHILTICILLCSLAVSAQDYERVFRRNFWNNSRNISGVRQDTISRSYAEIYGRYESGEYRDTWQAEDSWSAGAVTASIRHLDKISLAGAFSFEQTEGYGMCGSMFIDPGFYPVDILEFTPGRKTLQTYAFDGGISYDASRHWRIGAWVDFESANFAKRKDLRHTNWKLDLDVAPGFMYHNGDFAIGAVYLFSKTSESIYAEQVGTAESSYYAFLDKGLMYGIHSVWTGSGLHLDEAGVNRFPVKEFSNGAAVQIQYGGFFAEAEYLGTRGIIGEKEYIWFRFPGNSASAKVAYRHIGERYQHFARLGFSWKEQALDERVLEKVTTNGITSVLDHGANRIFTKGVWSLTPEYEFVSERAEISVSADIRRNAGLSSQMYPYMYERSIDTCRGDIKAKVHLGRFTPGAALGYKTGRVVEKERLAADNTGVQSVPFRLQEWYDRSMEYATSDRISADLSLRYSFPKGLYLEAGGSLVHGFGLRYISGGADRFGGTLKIGYDF